MANFLIVWNDDGNILRTKILKRHAASGPDQGDMSGMSMMLVSINFPPYFLNTGNRHLGIYCLTTDGTTLRIYYAQTRWRPRPHGRSRNLHMTDATVETSSTHRASESRSKASCSPVGTPVRQLLRRTTGRQPLGAAVQPTSVQTGTDTTTDDSPFGLAVTARRS